MKTMLLGCTAVLAMCSITMTAQDYGEPNPGPATATPVALGAIVADPPQAKVQDDLFAGTEKFAKGATDVTDVNLGPDMLSMVTGKRGDAAHKMNFMVVRTYSYPRAGMFSMDDVDAYRQKLRTGNWNCFIHTMESKTGESTDICGRALPDNKGNEMVILTVEAKELSFIHLSGLGSWAELSAMAGSMGTPTPPTPPAPPAPAKP